MHTGYDREEDEGYHWSVELVIGVVGVGVAAFVVLIPLWI